ncbi:MAG: TetR/AcrR family transcriptional regulator [Ruminococcus sp.]|nr:TetR/AcrR family transcriptional regulator [Ruminococcus sp.]
MEKKPKSVDRRVLKTKRAIRNAFAKLMVEKDINDITIMELADTADINRKTFYNYYSGVYQVVEDIERDILTSYEELLGGIEFKQYMNTPYSLFERFSLLINMDPEFFGYLLSMNGNVNLITRIMRLLKDKTCEVMVAQLDLDAYKADIMLDFVLSGMLSVYQHWFNSEQSISAEEVSQIISTMSFSGINGIINNS